MFAADPSGGNLLAGATYWLYARHALVPAYEPGSIETNLAYSFQLTAANQAIPLNADGQLSGGVPADVPPPASGAVSFIPAGTTVGSGWQYQLQRGTSVSSWQNWASGFKFTTDPAGGAIQRDQPYWLYARNNSLPSGTPGATDSVLVASVMVTTDGYASSLSPDALAYDADLLQKAIINRGGYEFPEGNQETALDAWPGFKRYGANLRLVNVTISAIVHAFANGFLTVTDIAREFRQALRIRLSELVEYIMFDNLQLWGPYSNIYTVRQPADPATERGWYDKTILPSGQEVINGGVNKTADNAFGIFVGDGHEFRLKGHKLSTNALNLDAPNTDTLFRTLSVSVLPVAQRTPQYYVVAERLDDGSYQLRFATPSQEVDGEMPEILSRLPSGTGTVSGAQVEFVGCIDRTDPAPPEDTLTITNATNGAVINHRLLTANLLPQFFVLRPDNSYRVEQDIDFSATSSTTVTLSIPSERSPWSGRIVLKPANP